MRIALLLILAAGAPADRYDEAAERIRFPAADRLIEWASKGDAHRKLLVEFTDRKKFSAGFRMIEEKLGIFLPEVDVEVMFEESDDRRPARAGGKDGKGRIFFNLSRLVENERRLEDFEAQRRAGRNMVWLVPPTSYDVVVAHELVHVVCGTFQERWITEGLACWVAGDTASLHAFGHRKGTVESIDIPVTEDDAYPRGLLFFLWIEQRWNRPMVRAFIDRVRSRSESPGEALFALSGNTWARMSDEEQGWSKAYVARLKKAP